MHSHQEGSTTCVVFNTEWGTGKIQCKIWDYVKPKMLKYVFFCKFYTKIFIFTIKLSFLYSI